MEKTTRADANVKSAGLDLIRSVVPDWLKLESTGPAAHASMIEALMLCAHSYREGERIDEANALYQIVSEMDGPGAIRSSARFWLGLSNRSGGTRARDWGENLEADLGSPWARYALFEENVASLWASYGDSIVPVGASK